jgi:hypothetical protein
MARELAQAVALLLGVAVLGGCAHFVPLGTTPAVLNNEYDLDRQSNINRLSALLLRNIEQVQDREAAMHDDGAIDTSAHQQVQQSLRTLNAAALREMEILKDLRESASTRQDALQALLSAVQSATNEATSRVTPRVALALSDSFAAIRATAEELATVA